MRFDLRIHQRCSGRVFCSAKPCGKASFEGRNSAFLVLPTDPLERGKPLEFEFKNEGRVVQELATTSILSAHATIGYPKLPTQFAKYEVTFQFPKSLSLVVAGEVAEQEPTASETSLAHALSILSAFWASTSATTLASACEGPYEIEGLMPNKQFEPGCAPSPQPADGSYSTAWLTIQ